MIGKAILLAGVFDDMKTLTKIMKVMVRQLETTNDLLRVIVSQLCCQLCLILLVVGVHYMSKLLVKREPGLHGEEL